MSTESMDNAGDRKAGWKQKLFREMVEYLINFIYLAVFFGVFTWYRRLILASYEIDYLNYGISLVEAAVLAKVVMIGQFFGLDSHAAGRPLIFPTLRKSVVFTIFVGLFKILEYMLRGLVDGIGLSGGFAEFVDKGEDEVLASCLVVFFAFIPFFAFRELGRVFGQGFIRSMFFRRGKIPESTCIE
ncbi:MAG: hypothetical protein ABFD62_07425 [Syntrophaceae bacterium]